jgi:hypothetical protein
MMPACTQKGRHIKRLASAKENMARLFAAAGLHDGLTRPREVYSVMPVVRRPWHSSAGAAACTSFTADAHHWK